MKATLFTSAIVLCAFTAFAADQQAAPADSETAKTTVSEQTLSAPPASSAQQDSPLVAAAKRTHRLGKNPGTVITNDTLTKSGGHFTTTKTQESLPDTAAARAGNAVSSDKPLTTNNTPATNAPAKKTSSDKATKEQRQTAVKHAVADYMGDSVEPLTEDPATQEGVVSQTVAPKPAAAPQAAPRPAAPQRPPGI